MGLLYDSVLDPAVSSTQERRLEALNTWTRQILIAAAVIAAPTVAYAYGGWDYSDPQGQIWVVFRKTCKAVVFYIALPYGCFVWLQTIAFRKSRLKAIIVFLLYFLWLVVNLTLIGVKGEAGPAHLAYAITGHASLAAAGLLLLRTVVGIVIGPAQAALKPKWQCLPIMLEIAALIIILTLPFLIGDSYMAAAGRSKCRVFHMPIAADWVYEYREDHHAYPSSIRAIFIDVYGDELPEYGRVCPVTAQEYVYRLTNREDVITVQCPTHGSRQLNLNDI
jgi:hypothetical protein